MLLSNFNNYSEYLAWYTEYVNSDTDTGTTIQEPLSMEEYTYLRELGVSETRPRLGGYKAPKPSHGFSASTMW